MIRTLFTSQLNNPQSKQVQSLFTQVFVFLTRHRSFTTSLGSKERSLSPSSPEKTESSKHFPSTNFCGIAKSVISKCSHLWDSSSKGECSGNLSVKVYFLRLSNISPETIRRFWRVSVLRPQDVLDILLGFEFDSEKFEIELKKVESLWGVYKRASEQYRNFQHLPRSCSIMAKLLVRVAMFTEADYLLSGLDGKGVFLDYHEIFSDLIEGYVAECDLERAISNYDRMRRLGLSPSLSCYRSLLHSLIQMNETQLAYRTYLDMIELGFGRSEAEKGIYEKVVQLLCIEGKVQEARNLVKRNIALGIEPNDLVLDAIVSGYCQKMDYHDILNFLFEIRRAPDVVVGNKVICSLSRKFGAQRANMFMRELEQFGFCPNEMTFGILIGQTCFEGNVKDAFIFLSEMLSRGLKPDINTCNALMGGLFKEGLWKQSLDILLEMNDWRIVPNLSTFRILLAGLFKARQFGEVKAIVGEMADRGLVEISLPEDHLSIALTVLGLDPVAVKVRRDNDLRFSKTEVFDDLGNGLYLETDVDAFEKTIVKVLEEAMIPDFISFVLENCRDRDIKIAVEMVDEMAKWGEVLPASALSMLVNRLSGSHINIKTINNVLEKMPYSIYQLDQGALNKLVQKFCKRGCACKAKMIFDNMVRMKLEIENETYSGLLIGLCKKGNLRSFQHYWQLAGECNWLPELKDGKVLLGCLCHPKLLNEALELLETILMECCDRPLDASHALIGKLCSRGFTSVADVLAKELTEQGLVLDEKIYNHLLSGFCKEKKLAQAFLLVDTMIAKKFDPSLDVLLQLILQLSRTDKFDKALLLKDICLEKQSSALLSVYCTLTNELCKLGRVGEASSLFQEMSSKRQHPKGEEFNMLVQGYCQVFDLKKVGELLCVMTRKNIGLSITGYRSLVQLACAAGKLSAALSLKKLMLDETSLPGIAVYNILIFYLSSSKQGVHVVDTIVHELQNKGLKLDTVSYDFIIKGTSDCKDVSRSVWYLKKMISGGIVPSRRSLRKVMSMLCWRGELGKALELSQEMESRGWIHGSVIQINMVEALLANGKLQEAMRYLDRMASKDLMPRKVDYDCLIKRLCQHGELEKASDLLNTMIKKGSILDSTSFDYLIQGFCRCDELDSALDYHSEMLYRNLIPSSNCWKILVSRLSEGGRVVDAEKLIHEMYKRGETPTKEMYSSVINKYRAQKNLRKASELLLEMQRSGHEPDFETHWSLISNFSNPINKEDQTKSGGFLSRLLSGIGFSRKD